MNRPDKNTGLVILGSIHNYHNRNRNYSVSELEQIILSLKPESIFCECTPDFIENGSYRKEILNKWKVPEIIVEDKISKKLEIPLFPIDMAGEKDIYKIIEEINILLKNYYTALNKSSPESHQVKIIELFYSTCAGLSEIVLKCGADFINSAGYDEIINMKHRLWFEIIPETMPYNSDFIKLKSDILTYKKFWEKRNETMVKNTIDIINTNKFDRVLLITGSEHRSILKKYFNKYNINVKEYYEV